MGNQYIKFHSLRMCQTCFDHFDDTHRLCKGKLNKLDVFWLMIAYACSGFWLPLWAWCCVSKSCGKFCMLAVWFWLLGFTGYIWSMMWLWRITMDAWPGDGTGVSGIKKKVAAAFADAVDEAADAVDEETDEDELVRKALLKR